MIIQDVVVTTNSKATNVVAEVMAKVWIMNCAGTKYVEDSGIA